MDNVIKFDPREKILEKAKRYVEDEEVFLEEREQAVPLLLRALEFGDETLKSEIIFLLGSFAKEEVAWPLYRILADPSQEEEIRRDASIQLSVIGPFLKAPQPLMDRLIQDMESGDAELRFHATFAVGWEGNTQAAIPLIERLYDGEIRVQQTAVSALSNLRDDKIINLLLERLEHGPLMQKRAILLNLWRFYSKKEEVVQVYLQHLGHENADLRFEALALLGIVSSARKHFEAYGKCLKDPDARIRGLALRKLAEEGGSQLKEIKEEIAVLLDDPDMNVKRAALDALKKFHTTKK
jgi:HEAT repeat protein